MLLQVQGKEFVDKVVSLIGGRDTTLTLRPINSVLYVQSSQEVIRDTQVAIIESDYNKRDSVDEVSITVDTVLNLLSKEEPVWIDINEELVVIKQGNFNYNAVVNPEIMVPTKAFDKRDWSSATVFSFMEFMENTKYIDRVAKDIGVSENYLTFYNNKGYMLLDNIVYVDSAEVPNFDIMGSAAKKLQKTFQTSHPDFYSLEMEGNNIKYKLRDSSVVTANIKKCDQRKVEIVEDIFNNSKLVACINLTKYKEQIVQLCRTYTKVLVELAIYKDAICLHINNGTTRCIIGGGEGLPVVTTKISINQLYALNNLFGGFGNVLVKRGTNTLTFNVPSCERALIIPGVLY